VLNPDTSGNLWPRVATKMHTKMISSQDMISFAKHSRNKKQNLIIKECDAEEENEMVLAFDYDCDDLFTGMLIQ